MTQHILTPEGAAQEAFALLRPESHTQTPIEARQIDRLEEHLYGFTSMYDVALHRMDSGFWAVEIHSIDGMLLATCWIEPASESSSSYFYWES